MPAPHPLVPNRRDFLGSALGFGSLAFGALNHHAHADRPHHRPRAKSVIWIFLSGGYSHLETFDPKPALNIHAGKTFDKAPIADPFKNPVLEKRSRSVIEKVRDRYPIIYPLQIGYKQHGQCGAGISDWLPHIARYADDIAFVRNMYTTDNDHAAENQIHTGRHKLDPQEPSIGAWVHYGLGSLNDNLPQFVVLGGPTRTDTRLSIAANYLGPQHAGVPLKIDPANPLPFGRPPAGKPAAIQQNEFDLVARLNRLTAAERPHDADLRARIRAAELAFKMQTAVPEAMDFKPETADIRKMYGLDQSATKAAGQRCLAARRLVERGVRFVQVFPTPYGRWDSHRALKKNHATQCAAVDQPVAALLQDLKQRGLWDDVTVVFCTEFGRTPGLEQRGGGKDGRDHHPHGFTVWLAGAGIAGGTVHGETDELGFHAIEPAHYVTDLHATVLHLMGLDPEKLDIPGRQRLDIDRGKPIRGIFNFS